MTRLYARLAAISLTDARKLWVRRVLAEKERSAAIIRVLSHDGYEPVEVAEGGVVTDDGREVLRIGRAAWALRPELHAAQLEERMAAIRAARAENVTKSVGGTESLSRMTCPKCGDSLQHTAVCPSCAAGKLGYRHRYTCVCGGVDMISKESL